MIDWIALVIAIALWVCVGHQIASDDHWAVNAFFVALAVANTFVAVKGAL